MKNLFKNLMLVAVAAMAFTACQNDNNEVNEVAKKTVITGVATIDANDTRSGFVGKNEAGDAYVSEWDGGEYIRLFYSGWSDYTEIDDEGNFELDYIGDFDPGATATVCSPYDSWSTVNEYVIPEPQTPRENSVDPMAHILKSDATEIINGTLSVKMKHAVAYGKVSFPELSLDGDAVSNVVLDIDGTEYTINTSATQNIWFACEPNGTVSNMTVTVNTNGDQALYKKIIENGNKNLSFDKGIVSTFNVKGLEQKPTEPVEADFNVTLTKVTSIVDNVIRFEGDNAEDYITIAFNPGLETIVAGHYTSVVQDWFNGGAWAWSSESALEVKNEFEGSSVEVNAAGGGTWYYDTNSNGVDVSVEDGIYTIVAHLNNAGAGNKNVDFTYVGTLEVVEPEQPDLTDIPAFNKARSAYSSGQDRQLYFNSDELSELVVNFYHCFDDNSNKLKEGTYTTPGSAGIYAAGYSTYAGTKITYMKATVSYVSAGYQIIFEDIQNESGVVMLQKAIYIGEIENLAEIATMPKMELDKETVIFKAIGGTDTIKVTLKNYTADIEITTQGDANGEWFNATLSNNTITIEATANELEEQRTGTITITAGDITKTVDLMILGANAQKGVKENPYELEVTGYKSGWNIDFSCQDNGATLHLELNGSISGTALNMEHSLHYEGSWWQADHKYVVNGVTYTHDDFAPNSTSITEKLSDGTYKTLFKIVAGGTTTYYVAVTPSNY